MNERTKSIASSVSNAAASLISREIGEGDVELSKRLSEFDSVTKSPEFLQSVESNAAGLTSFLYCFSTVKKRALEVKTSKDELSKNDGKKPRGGLENILFMMKPISSWSEEWNLEGETVKEKSSPEEWEQKSMLYRPFDESCLEEFGAMCRFKQAQGDYGAQRKWSYFGVDLLTQCVSEASQATSEFRINCAWSFVTSIMLSLPSPDDLTSLKGSEFASESMVEQCRVMDSLEANFAATCLLDINSHVETQLASSISDTCPTIYAHEELCSVRLRFIISSLWIIFRYYLPRHLTLSVTHLNIPRHSQWLDLIDVICSDSITSFITIVKPELMTYLYVLASILNNRRRSDPNEPIVAHTMNQPENNVYGKLLNALSLHSFDEVNKLLAEMPNDVEGDFFLSPLVSQLVEQFSLSAFESYYKIHKSIDNDGMVTSLDVKLLALRMRNADNADRTSGDTQQLLVRSSYLINQLEKEVDKNLSSLGM
eukprot:GHVH01003701.1.p1 GENE.GHVH01003701.1~~GHVH01003701.1.p1  ORF type:complete len:483 (+),score=77.11 GHVH01003701.1:77-1525(+)